MTGAGFSTTTLAILSALVEERLGLHYREQDRAIFEGKIGDRLSASGFASPLDYYYYLRYDDPSGDEWRRLADALLVGETYFFRELDALESAFESVLGPAVAAHRDRRVRVLSAACATGEEPLSIAMMARARGLADALDIVAVDVNETALRRARAGTYRERSLRSLPAAHAHWLTPRPDAPGSFDADPTLVARVDYRHVNLLDRPAVAALGLFDLVLARNVLIYFRDETVVDVVKSLTAVMGPRARLLVGASESLLRFGLDLVCEERKGAFFYRRPP